MKQNTRLAAVSLSVLLALSVIGPGLALANTESSNGNLAIDIAVDNDARVTVTDDGDSAANATVNVTVDDGNETITGSNGTVDSGNHTYAGIGTYTTDENGTVELPTPDKRLHVTIRATVDNRTTTAHETLPVDSETDVGPIGEVNPEQPFGLQVPSFVQRLSNLDDNGTIGQRVAGFVTSNNPGNPPAHAGPGDATAENKPGSANGMETDGRTGPPAHAGAPDHAGTDSNTGDESDSRDEADNDDGMHTDDAVDSDDGEGESDREETDRGADRDGAENSNGSGPGNSGKTPGNGPPGR